VVKLVDAVDSKSTGHLARAGSIPAFGTIIARSIKAKLLKALFYDHGDSQHSIITLTFVCLPESSLVYTGISFLPAETTN